MRLTRDECRVIEESARAVFPDGTEVFLFGSRTDDTRRGGDIDLLITPPGPVSAEDRVKWRTRFVAKLYTAIDEQKIDVLIVPRDADDRRPVIVEARAHGKRLARV